MLRGVAKRLKKKVQDHFLRHFLVCGPLPPLLSQVSVTLLWPTSSTSSCLSTVVLWFHPLNMDNSSHSRLSNFVLCSGFSSWVILFISPHFSSPITSFIFLMHLDQGSVNSPLPVFVKQNKTKQKCWNAAMSICLYIICGWFHTTLAKLSSCSRDHMT